jgi:hypothetical protein
MAASIVSKPFSITLSGSVHLPYEIFDLDLCALLFSSDETTSPTFTGTVQYRPNVVGGIAVEERQGSRSTMRIDVAKVDSTYTRLVIAAHAEEAEGPCRCSDDDSATTNPTLESLSYSIRALEFGHSASFIKEAAILGVKLLTLERTQQGWQLDDSQRPADYPQLVTFARENRIELAPWGS